MTPSTPFRLAIALLLACLLPFLSGCNTARTAVSYDTEFQPDEGLVVLRVIDVSNGRIRTFKVVSEKTGEEFWLRAEKFGQSSTNNFVGRLPAGRYQPTDLFSAKWEGAGIVQKIIPLQELTGKFDVEAHRLTDLGTMVFMEVDGKRLEEQSAGRGVKWKSLFHLPLDPTPVPAEAMLAARFPHLAKANASRSALGWVAGTVPPQPANLIDEARRRVKAVSNPVFIDGDTLLAGGSLGIVAKHVPGAAPRSFRIDTVHAIESILVLSDGRWLAGGEEGFLALSSDKGATWERLSGLSPEALVIHLSETMDGRLLMVTDLDREAVVHESGRNPIAWKVIKRIPSDRPQGALTQEFGESAKFLRDYAAASRDRLVVFTRQNTLNSLDLRTGQWESFSTPRNFNGGIKVTPDGFVLGNHMVGWIYGSDDYGKTWNRLESWVNMSQAHFIDRHRGVMLAAEVPMLSIPPFKVRTTEDGGKTWKTGAEVGHGWWDLPLWTDPAGKFLYVTSEKRQILMSRDQGATWQ